MWRENSFFQKFCVNKNDKILFQFIGYKNDIYSLELKTRCKYIYIFEKFVSQSKVWRERIVNSVQIVKQKKQAKDTQKW